MSALPHAVCPLCGGANRCAPAASGTLDVPCWCTRATVSREALERVPAEWRGKACLCPRCAGVVDPPADAEGRPAHLGDPRPAAR